MGHKDERQLAGYILGDRTDGVTMIKGEVHSVGSGPDIGKLSVNLGGEAIPVPGLRYFDHYTPTVGDVVWCLKFGPSLLVLGTLADTA